MKHRATRDLLVRQMQRSVARLDAAAEYRFADSVSAVRVVRSIGCNNLPSPRRYLDSNDVGPMV